MIDEVLQDFAAARGVCDFGMKLQAVEFSLRIFHGGEGRAAGVGSDTKTSRQRSYLVTMTVPNVNLMPQTIEKLRAVSYIKDGGAVLTTSSVTDLATEMMGHLHQAIANSENRNSEIKNLWIDLRCAVFINAGWSAGKDNAVWWLASDVLSRRVEMDDLRVNLEFANTAADYLSVLRAEIEDENFRMLRRCLRLHTLWMGLGNRMFTGGIARGPLFRADRSLAGHAALELTSDFLRAAFFERISTPSYNERARANDRQGLHLLILGSERCNARAWLKR